MKAHNLKATSVANLEQQIADLTKKQFQPTLALVFCSVSFDLPAISAVFDKYQIQAVGCTTAGEIQDYDTNEQSIVAMLMDMRKENFKVFLQGSTNFDVFSAAQSIAQKAKETFENPVLFVLTCGIRADGQQAVEGLRSVLGSDVPIYGGLAADDLRVQATYAFSEKQVIEQGVLALVLNGDKIETKGITTSGWQAVGNPKKVTKSSGNIVHMIDNLPAAEAYMHYLGIDKETEAVTMRAMFPLQVQRADGTFVLRAPVMRIKEDNSLVFAGTVPQGATVRFSTEPGAEIIEEVVKQINQLKESFPEPEAIWVVSCAARKLSFGITIEEEIQGIKDVWDAPLIGFFSYGEIGALQNGKCDFHNETISLLVLREK
ncbi:MAG: FIST C-terminal domain-containing protein [Microscillaceae bacterium]|nr:FIST C-terminal domain-containing protein [Microscillaceae bacterium]MDW8460064.1 FIST N-terminal domain-containing protein [Cytophagales bacterium]